MSRPFHDYPAGPSCSDNAPWHYQQNVSYDYPSRYDVYSSGARAAALGESGSTSGFPDSATFSPSYDYADSPEIFSFDEYESSSPLSPSCSTTSSSSSCSDAPITPYYQGTNGLPLPAVPLLYTKLDAPVGGEYQEAVSPEPAYECEEWDEDVTQTYSSVAMPESSIRSSAAHPNYDTNAAALWACEAAIAQFQYFDTSPTSARAPDPPTYATYLTSDSTAVASSPVSPQHAHDQYPPSSHPQVSCLPPAFLSCFPLKLHQPQPRRSIPVVSLSELASASSDDVSQSSPHFQRTTPSVLSPHELQSPSSHDVSMTSYLPASAGAFPMAAYPSSCSCSKCTGHYSIL
ncbi:hypothetical protein MSAN_02233000 [Mycena sanguinolenta]|uniref:Uncharacterized protein n=1 Tax=Mycena sanguinolenta TaxID=230812 RepID=A0A8H6XBJ8_9AGAR|nr:hypothetical protein MSAN_02233000 [Mycena sanguinolenta]